MAQSGVELGCTMCAFNILFGEVIRWESRGLGESSGNSQKKDLKIDINNAELHTLRTNLRHH